MAAFMWVGITAYFVLVDNVLLPPRGDSVEEGVEGERYWLHGGGFYFMRRYDTGPRELPDDVMWHPQWYAYTTWLSGFLLFAVLYYWKAGSYLIDPSVANIRPGLAVAISIGILAFGWIYYDLVSKALVGRDLLLGVILLLTIGGTAFGLSHLFSARGMTIQVGALLGTWMAGNVVFVFSPAHRKQYKAKEQGTTVDPRVPQKSAQRGMHNTYLALPVLLAMLSGHFTFIYESNHAWQALIVLMIVGASIRFFFVMRQRGRVLWQIPAAAVVVVVALAVLIAPPDGSSSGSAVASAPPSRAPASTAAGRSVFLTAGCTSCHTLADAGARGTVGPNLDDAKPPRSLVLDRVTHGQGVMPSFSSRLTPAQIDAVADYVVAATQGR